jgi:predicted GNAT family N-acyltransferase
MTVRLHRVPGEATLADAHAVRRAVFIREQGVSEAEEMDGRDGDASHVVAYAPPAGENGIAGTGVSESGDGPRQSDPGGDGPGLRPVGTARLRVPEPGVAKPERVAVLETYRGEGIGRRLMRAVEQDARERGCERACLHAQTVVESFYRDLGYRTTSNVFEEADIPHVEMEKTL